MPLYKQRQASLWSCKRAAAAPPHFPQACAACVNTALEYSNSEMVVL